MRKTAIFSGDECRTLPAYYIHFLVAKIAALGMLGADARQDVLSRKPVR